MLTTERRNRILASLDDYDRFIAKEQARNPKFRPPQVEKTLEDYLKKRAELETALDADSEDCLTFPGQSK